MKNLLPSLLTLLALPALLGLARPGSAQPAGPPANGGVVTTLAGAAGKAGKTNGAGVAARFNYSAAVAAAANGTLYVADGNHVIRKITPAGVVTTLAGTAGKTGTANGQGAAARFYMPDGIAVDAKGNVYVSESMSHTVRKITPAGLVTALAGKADAEGAVNGRGTAARFTSPYGVAVDRAGTVYVSDLSYTVRKISPTGVVTTLAGVLGAFGPTQGGAINGPGAAARFTGAGGLAVDVQGTVYLAESACHRIRTITAAGMVGTLAGGEHDVAGSQGKGSTDGSPAYFSNPSGVAVDAAGNVYVADTENHNIRRIAADGTTRTLAGTAGPPGTADGTGPAARFANPSGVAVDAAGTVYVADHGNHTIRRIR